MGIYKDRKELIATYPKIAEDIFKGFVSSENELDEYWLGFSDDLHILYKGYRYTPYAHEHNGKFTIEFNPADEENHRDEEAAKRISKENIIKIPCGGRVIYVYKEPYSKEEYEQHWDIQLDPDYFIVDTVNCFSLYYQMEDNIFETIIEIAEKYGVLLETMDEHTIGLSEEDLEMFSVVAVTEKISEYPELQKIKSEWEQNFEHKEDMENNFMGWVDFTYHGKRFRISPKGKAYTDLFSLNSTKKAVKELEELGATLVNVHSWDSMD